MGKRGAVVFTAGDFNIEVMIQKPVNTPQGAGGSKPVWTDVDTDWANDKVSRPFVLSTAGAMRSAVRHDITIRWRNDVAIGWRLHALELDQYWYIQTVSDNYGGMRFLSLICTTAGT